MTLGIAKKASLRNLKTELSLALKSHFQKERKQYHYMKEYINMEKVQMEI